MARAARARWSASRDPRSCTLEFNGRPGFFVLFQPWEHGEHPAPQDLLDASLAASAALRLARFIRRAHFEVRALELEVTHLPTPDGLVLTLAIHVVGQLTDERQQRLLQVANGCAIRKILSGKIAVVTLEHLQREDR